MNFYYKDDETRALARDSNGYSTLYQIDISTSKLHELEKYLQTSLLQQSLSLYGLYRTVGVGNSFRIDRKSDVISMSSNDDIVGIDFIKKILTKNKQKVEEDFGFVRR